jgi:hypothetical protein
MFGGTVNSWAVVEVYPMPEIMDGRKRVKLYILSARITMKGEAKTYVKWHEQEEPNERAKVRLRC